MLLLLFVYLRLGLSGFVGLLFVLFNVPCGGPFWVPLLFPFGFLLLFCVGFLLGPFGFLMLLYAGFMRNYLSNQVQMQLLLLTFAWIEARCSGNSCKKKRKQEQCWSG